MKSLLLMRHAKSSWDDPTLDDHERPLKSRGRRASQRMGQLLVDRALIPDIVVCSTAVRARQTWELLAVRLAALPVAQPRVEFESRLYHCPPATFGEVLSELASSVEMALLIGHNPGLEDWLLQLLGRNEIFPTAALAHLLFECDDWSDVAQKSPGVRLAHIWRPRELDELAEEI